MKRAAALTLLLMATACEPPADRRDAQPAKSDAPAIRMKNEYEDRLRALRPGLQRIWAMRAVRGTGNACQRVDNAGYQQDYQNLRMWVAVCGVEGKSWAIYIAPNEDIQVRDCADLGQLSLPRCQGLPPPVPDNSGPQFKEGAADNAFRNQF